MAAGVAVASASRAALAGRAAASPEAPFLFYRGPTGEFVHWSWDRCLKEATAQAPGADEGDSAAARDYLRRLLGLDAASAAAGAALRSALPAFPERPIWLTCGRLERPHERTVASAALADGWAIVLEPGEAVAATTFAWARPTVAAGTAAELVALLDGIAALAPRRRGAAWVRRRLARLRAALTPAEDDPESVERRLRELGAPSIVLSIP